MTSTKVSVIVAHYNSARTIQRCISSLLRQDYPRELTRVIVVDGGSTDGSIQVVHRRENATVTQIVTQGCTEAEGQMIGVRRSDAEVIMFTNSDVYVPSDWIRKHLEWQGRGFDLVGGTVFWGGDKYSLTWNMPRPDRPQFVQKEGMGLGFSNCSVRRDILLKCGGIKNLVSQQDTEFAFRVVRGGGKMVLDPAIEVYHDHPLKTFRTCFRRSYLYTRNHVALMRASYGRIVMDPRQMTTISVVAVIREFLKEWTTVNGVRAYYEHNRRAAQEKIRISLIGFLFIRLFSTKLGQLLGGFAGIIMIRRPSLDSVTDAHRV